MAATVQQILESGFALSRLSRPELVTLQSAALVQVVNRVQQALFQFAARVNPLMFVRQVDVVFTAGYWQRPSDAESLFRIEATGATTPALTGVVLVVPYDDRNAFVGTPAVYRLWAAALSGWQRRGSHGRGVAAVL